MTQPEWNTTKQDGIDCHFTSDDIRKCVKGGISRGKCPFLKQRGGHRQDWFAQAKVKTAAKCL